MVEEVDRASERIAVTLGEARLSDTEMHNRHRGLVAVALLYSMSSPKSIILGSDSFFYQDLYQHAGKNGKRNISPVARHELLKRVGGYTRQEDERLRNTLTNIRQLEERRFRSVVNLAELLTHHYGVTPQQRLGVLGRRLLAHFQSPVNPNAVRDFDQEYLEDQIAADEAHAPVHTMQRRVDILKDVALFAQAPHTPNDLFQATCAVPVMLDATDRAFYSSVRETTDTIVTNYIIQGRK
jgi:hypothetical protein